MTEKRVLVTGATGLLGREVVGAFREKGWAVTGTGMSRADGVSILKVDLGNEPEVEGVLDAVRPQVVVHCAAHRFPDKVDKDPEAARRLNVAATSALAQLCAARSAVLIYISTDYVFPGRPGEAPYAASTSPAPTNLYGQTKLDGEKAVLEAYDVGRSCGKASTPPGRGVVLRIPVLYGHAEMPGESAVNVLMDAVWESQKLVEGTAEGEKKIKMDHWALRYPTNTEDVARVCADVAERYISAGPDESLPRILQFSSEDKLTKYEICQLFGEIMGLSIDRIEPDTRGNDPDASVQRPYDCHLSTKELKDLGIEVWTQDFTGWWRREVRAFRK